MAAAMRAREDAPMRAFLAAVAITAAIALSVACVQSHRQGAVGHAALLARAVGLIATSSRGFGLASGIIIEERGNEHIVLSASHVVRDEAFVFVRVGGRTVMARVLLDARRQELVVLGAPRVVGAPRTRVHTRRAPLVPGEPIYLVSAPFVDTPPLLFAGVASTSSFTCPPYLAEAAMCFAADFGAGPGVSGGGVFDQHHRLVGLALAVYAGRPAVAISVDGATVAGLLDAWRSGSHPEDPHAYDGQ